MKFEELLEILQDMHPEIDYETETQLIDKKIFTSFDIVAIIAELNDSFDLEIPAKAIVPENFNSAKALFSLIQSIENEDD